jgi:hypothetical protein
VAVWIRVAEGLDDAAFAQFRKICASAKAPVKIAGTVIDVRAPAEKGMLRLSADLKTEKRLLCEGADAKVETGILSVDGRDLGTASLN